MVWFTILFFTGILLETSENALSTTRKRVEASNSKVSSTETSIPKRTEIYFSLPYEFSKTMTPVKTDKPTSFTVTSAKSTYVNNMSKNASINKLTYINTPSHKPHKKLIVSSFHPNTHINTELTKVLALSTLSHLLTKVAKHMAISKESSSFHAAHSTTSYFKPKISTLTGKLMQSTSQSIKSSYNGNILTSIYNKIETTIPYIILREMKKSVPHIAPSRTPTSTTAEQDISSNIPHFETTLPLHIFNKIQTVSMPIIPESIALTKYTKETLSTIIAKVLQSTHRSLKTTSKQSNLFSKGDTHITDTKTRIYQENNSEPTQTSVPRISRISQSRTMITATVKQDISPNIPPFQTTLPIHIHNKIQTVPFSMIPESIALSKFTTEALSTIIAKVLQSTKTSLKNISKQSHLSSTGNIKRSIYQEMNSETTYASVPRISSRSHKTQPINRSNTRAKDIIISNVTGGLERSPEYAFDTLIPTNTYTESGISATILHGIQKPISELLHSHRSDKTFAIYNGIKATIPHFSITGIASIASLKQNIFSNVATSEINSSVKITVAFQKIPISTAVDTSVINTYIETDVSRIITARLESIPQLSKTVLKPAKVSSTTYSIPKKTLTPEDKQEPEIYSSLSHKFSKTLIYKTSNFIETSATLTYNLSNNTAVNIHSHTTRIPTTPYNIRKTSITSSSHLKTWTNVNYRSATSVLTRVPALSTLSDLLKKVAKHTVISSESSTFNAVHSITTYFKPNVSILTGKPLQPTSQSIKISYKKNKLMSTHNKHSTDFSTFVRKIKTMIPSITLPDMKESLQHMSQSRTMISATAKQDISPNIPHFKTTLPLHIFKKIQEITLSMIPESIALNKYTKECLSTITVQVLQSRHRSLKTILKQSNLFSPGNMIDIKTSIYQEINSERTQPSVPMIASCTYREEHIYRSNTRAKDIIISEVTGGLQRSSEYAFDTLIPTNTYIESAISTTILHGIQKPISELLHSHRSDKTFAIYNGIKATIPHFPISGIASIASLKDIPISTAVDKSVINTYMEAGISKVITQQLYSVPQLSKTVLKPVKVSSTTYSIPKRTSTPEDKLGTEIYSSLSHEISKTLSPVTLTYNMSQNAAVNNITRTTRITFHTNTPTRYNIRKTSRTSSPHLATYTNENYRSATSVLTRVPALSTLSHLLKKVAKHTVISSESSTFNAEHSITTYFKPKISTLTGNAMHPPMQSIKSSYNENKLMAMDNKYFTDISTYFQNIKTKAPSITLRGIKEVIPHVSISRTTISATAEQNISFNNSGFSTPILDDILNPTSELYNGVYKSDKMLTSSHSDYSFAILNEIKATISHFSISGVSSNAWLKQNLLSKRETSEIIPLVKVTETFQAVSLPIVVDSIARYKYITGDISQKMRTKLQTIPQSSKAVFKIAKPFSTVNIHMTDMKSSIYKESVIKAIKSLVPAASNNVFTRNHIYTSNVDSNIFVLLKVTDRLQRSPSSPLVTSIGITSYINADISTITTDKLQTTSYINADISTIRSDKLQTTSYINTDISTIITDKLQTTSYINISRK